MAGMLSKGAQGSGFVDCCSGLRAQSSERNAQDFLILALSPVLCALCFLPPAPLRLLRRSVHSAASGTEADAFSSIDDAEHRDSGFCYKRF